MEAVAGRPYIAKVVLSVTAGDSIGEKERVKNLRGKVGKEAGLGGRIDSECRVEKGGDDDCRDEDNPNLMRCAMPF